MFQKFLTLFFSLCCVVTGTFFLMHAIPGDPFIGDRVLPKEIMDALYAHYGLDKPLWVQFLRYIQGIFYGDLGPSIIYEGRTVNQVIADGFPISAHLALQAFLLAVPVGILLGTWAALKRSQWQDTFAMAISTLGVSVPNFILSSLLQYLFAVKLHLLPVARWGSFEHTILPTLALAAMPIAFIARLTRANMVQVLNQDYIRTAQSKGLPMFRIAIRHGLRNALLPVVAYLGPVFTQILTGSFMIEKIFAIPGLGQWMINSINARDYPMIMGLTIFFSSLLMLMMFLTDLLYALIDPRLRRKAHA
jgi:oligopeptide transport system permease protein